MCTYNKEHRKKYIKEHKKDISEWRKKDYEKNKDKLLKIKKIYYKNNKDIIINKVKERYKKDKDNILKYHRAYYEKNKDIIKNKVKNYVNTEIWYLNKTNAWHRRRQKIKTTNDWTITIDALQLLIIRQKNECNWCKKKLVVKWKRKYQIDHIEPICKWWLHTISNIQLLCNKCNNIKWAKIIDDIFFK